MILRELDGRNSSGELVTIWWCPETDVVSLTVHRDMPDGCELVTASIPEVPHDRVGEAFDHPYAFAAHSGAITLPERSSTYATTEDDYDADADENWPEDGGADYDGGTTTLNPGSEDA